ncbi:hypothetical protein THAOC_16404 [Thalassiosira oceanica]|uniref:Uncharacterized protein n=1 Tax=Thalassiosira oceanica TaxID=159749 RepID=K0SPM4_THAOC|nr:hypothetical protein THAOC_16404 [Thalassiosira oceanica]|eukprot:EJK62966.1 hypothetical protein THAOC_16404 [Thalassiosira oceanica]
MDPGTPVTQPRARTTRSRQLRPGLREKPILCRPNREERLQQLDSPQSLLDLCLDQALLAELEALAGVADFLCRTRRPACRKQRHQSLVPAVPSAFSSPTDGRASETAQPTNKDRHHRGSISDGNGGHDGFLWCVEKETEQPATPWRQQRRCSSDVMFTKFLV